MAALRKGPRRVIWALGAAMATARRWTDSERLLLEEVAERTWAAVERARAEAALQRAHALLEQRVQERTAEVQSLFRRLVSAQEEERRRIARDIHDQVSQQMTALRMHIEILRMKSQSNAPVVEQAERMQRLAEELDESIDFLAWDLRPAALEHLGLSAALETLVTGWSDRFGISADFSGTDHDRLRLSGDVEVNLYRVTQEALHNIAKHAQATLVDVRIEHDDREVRLAVIDNGRGFNPQRKNDDGMGLASMRERVALISGELTMSSRPGWERQCSFECHSRMAIRLARKSKETRE